MKVYDLAAEVAAAVQKRRIVLGAGAMTEHEKEFALARHQYMINKKLSEFNDEAITEINRCSGKTDLDEIEALANSLHASVKCGDIR